MVDYSKWKNIEISDDEDDTHPNIDTPSLFRWRHQARVERMEELQHEKLRLQHEKEEHERAIREAREKLKQGEGDKAELSKKLQELEKKSEDLSLAEETVKTKEIKAPWNVDTISQPGFAKTVINKEKPRQSDDDLTEEQREQRMKKFVKDNEKLLKQFGMLRKYDDSKKFLMEHSQLACDDTANYLVIWCINLEMEGKSELMAHVAHQCICMQFILELSKQLDIDPRGCVSSFFSRIQVAEPEYKSHFDSEVTSFKERIKTRAKVKLEEAIAEQEEQDRLARLGPGGLDPAEVFESLPPELQKCFESRDIPLLQQTIAKMDEADAKYHIKRCVDSGLWVPEGGANASVTEEEIDLATDDEPEEIYHEALDNTEKAKPAANPTNDLDLD